MTPPCLRCSRPTDDGFACMHCGVTKPGAWLAEIADMVPAARDVAHGLSSRLSGSGGSGKPGSRLPLDLGATARLDAVQGELGTLVRQIAEERGIELRASITDPIAFAARWLSGHLEWLRHRPEVDEGLRTIEACARVVRGIARGPAAQKYLGPCGAWRFMERDLDKDRFVVEGAKFECDGDVYVRGDASTGRCRACGGEVAVAERRVWLDEQARASDLAWTASGIADALGINVRTLRAWATERRAPNGVVLRHARLATYWHNGEHLVPWVEAREGEDIKARGDRLHYVADVVALAQEVADRRAENERISTLIAG